MPVSVSTINFVPSGTFLTISLTSLDTLARVRGGKFSIDIVLLDPDDDDDHIAGSRIMMIDGCIGIGDDSDCYRIIMYNKTVLSNLHCDCAQ
jgi:hypothetical protein